MGFGRNQSLLTSAPTILRHVLTSFWLGAGQISCLPPKPRRGGLFIGQNVNHFPFFCFSAARHLQLRSRPGCQRQPHSTYENGHRAAPPKNKKNNLRVFVAINRPPLRGFKPYREAAGMWIWRPSALVSLKNSTEGEGNDKASMRRRRFLRCAHPG